MQRPVLRHREAAVAGRSAGEGSMALKRFRTRPVEVQAQQWYPEMEVPGVLFERWGLSPERHYYAATASGRVYLSPGDWVVYDLGGTALEVLPPGEFAAKYQEGP